MISFFFWAWLSLARAPGSGPGGRRFKSSRPDLQSSLLSVRYSDGAGVCYFGLESSGGTTEGTQLLGRGSLHCGSHRLILGMHIAFRDGNIAVSGKIGQREGVHLRCPSCQARVAETIQLERLNACHLEHTGLVVSLPRNFPYGRSAWVQETAIRSDSPEFGLQQRPSRAASWECAGVRLLFCHR